jgi:hypothetical protein
VNYVWWCGKIFQGLICGFCDPEVPSASYN